MLFIPRLDCTSFKYIFLIYTGNICTVIGVVRYFKFIVRYRPARFSRIFTLMGNAH
jgi:hypothetical protein